MKNYLDKLKEKIKFISLFYSKKLKHCSYIKLTREHFFFFDGEIFLKTPLLNPIIKNEVVLEADLLINLFKKMPNMKFDIAFSESNITFLGEKKLSIIFSLLTDIEFPAIKFPEFWEELPNNFKKAMDFCSFSISSNVTDGVLSCFYISEMEIISSDNFRATKYYLTESFDFETKEKYTLITNDLYKRINKLSITDYVIGKNNIYLSGHDPFKFYLALPVLEEKYPQELIDMFPQKKEKDFILTITHFTQEFKDMITNSSFLIPDGVKQKEEYIELEFTGVHITCTSKHAKGSIVETIKRKEVTPDSFLGTINIDPHLLIKAFDKYDKVIVTDNFVFFFDGKSEHIIELIEETQNVS
jgi:hypothetical protein